MILDTQEVLEGYFLKLLGINHPVVLGLRGGLRADRFKWSYGVPINGRESIGNWGNHSNKWSYNNVITLLIAGRGW